MNKEKECRDLTEKELNDIGRKAGQLAVKVFNRALSKGLVKVKDYPNISYHSFSILYNNSADLLFLNLIKNFYHGQKFKELNFAELMVNHTKAIEIGARDFIKNEPTLLKKESGN